MLVLAIHRINRYFIVFVLALIHSGLSTIASYLSKMQCFQDLAYNSLCKNKKAIIKHLGSIKTANYVVLIVSLLLLNLIVLNTGLMIYWHFKFILNLQTKSTLWLICQHLPGIAVIASLASTVSWPLCLFLTSANLALKNLDKWDHLPPYYKQIRFFQRQLVMKFLKCLKPLEFKVLHEALGDKLPTELLLQVFDYTKIRLETDCFKMIKISEMNVLQKVLSCVISIGDVPELVVFVHRLNMDENIWLFVICKDIFVFMSFVVSYISLIIYIWRV